MEYSRQPKVMYINCKLTVYTDMYYKSVIITTFNNQVDNKYQSIILLIIDNIYNILLIVEYYTINDL